MAHFHVGEHVGPWQVIEVGLVVANSAMRGATGRTPRSCKIRIAVYDPPTTTPPASRRILTAELIFEVTYADGDE